jgi:hypothetical protein
MRVNGVCLWTFRRRRNDTLGDWFGDRSGEDEGVILSGMYINGLIVSTTFHNLFIQICKFN